MKGKNKFKEFVEVQKRWRSEEGNGEGEKKVIKHA
jgi:hypothetical protein